MKDRLDKQRPGGYARGMRRLVLGLVLGVALVGGAPGEACAAPCVSNFVCGPDGRCVLCVTCCSGMGCVTNCF
jgi:hypothetical protein